MSVIRKIGEAKIDLAQELWTVHDRADKFLLNRRLVDTRKDVKEVRKYYTKLLSVDTPSRRKPDKRREYFKIREEYQKKMSECLSKVYAEILQASFTHPVPLKKDRDYDHSSEWRYCLYHGVVYQFDRPGYSSQDMEAQIRALEPPAENPR